MNAGIVLIFQFSDHKKNYQGWRLLFFSESTLHTRALGQEVAGLASLACEVKIGSFIAYLNKGPVKRGIVEGSE